MKIIKLQNGIVVENTYIVSENSDALIIDPGEETDLIEKTLADNSLVCRAVLLTHAHFDHCASCAVLKSEGAKIYMHKKDEKLVFSTGNLSAKFGKSFFTFKADEFVRDGQELDLCGMKVKVLHTPGHTEGSCCYIIGNVLFSGDTLFNLGAGRTDFPSGNAKQMKKSFAKLFALDTDYSVFPGHGMPTKLNFEKRSNPFFSIK